MNQWHYTKLGLQQGAVSEDELRGKIQRGEIGDEELVWRDGMAEWKLLAEVGELGSLAPGGGEVRLEQPPAFEGSYVAPDIPTYLVPSIVGTVLSAMCMFVFCLAPGVITGVVAMVYASQVDGLKARGDLIGASSSSRTARVWMIVTYAMLALPLLGLAAFAIFAIMGH